MQLIYTICTGMPCCGPLISVQSRAAAAAAAAKSPQSCPTLCDPIDGSLPANKHLVLCHSLLHLPQIFPSLRIFSSELALLIRWPKYWSFNFSISPSNEYSGLISFRNQAANAGDQGSIPGQGTKSPMLQPKPGAAM